MATDWMPYCLTCNKSYDMWNCRRPEFIRYLIDNSELLAKFGEFQNGTVVDIEVHTWYGNLLPEWFREHFGHQLVAKNEYGRYLDSDGKEVPVP